jgi:hypothetical protein
VVITGDHLNVRDFQITVGGAPAVVTATGPHRAEFVVPTGIPLGPTTVVATGAHGRSDPVRGEMPFQLCDLAIPASWAGQWQITLTYRDPTTSDVVAVDHVTTVIHPGEPIGLSALGNVAACSANVTADRTEASCAADVALEPCRIQATVQVAIDRFGAGLSGSGNAFATVGGLCPSSTEASVVELSGVLVDPDPGPEVPGASPLEQLVRTAAVKFSRTLAFASFTVESLRLAPLAFRARGAFDLAGGSGGIDPVGEKVGIRIGAFTTTLPAGSFLPLPNPQRGARFDGTTPEGVTLNVTIRRQHALGAFAFTISGAGLDLGGAADPFLVSLLIGDDASSARVRPALSE